MTYDQRRILRPGNLEATAVSPPQQKGRSLPELSQSASQRVLSLRALPGSESTSKDAALSNAMQTGSHKVMTLDDRTGDQ